jgi:TRAP-type uncharacterized transport system substrate-binding protein
MAVKQMNINSLSNPADREKLLKVIRDCSDSLTRIAAERDLIKESIVEISKKLELPKPLVRKMVKVYFKQNYDEEVAVQDQFETLYETVVK